MTRAMANSKTLDDILRGLREDVRETCGPEDWEADRITEYLRGLADRIEAAAKREKVEAVTIAATKAINLTDEQWRRDTGNAAAMRAALVELLNDAEHGYDIRDAPVAGAPGERQTYHVVDAEYIIDSCRAALAAPTRNCDLFSSYAEAENYWHENVECAEVNGCFDVWLFDPAEGGAE